MKQVFRFVSVSTRGSCPNCVRGSARENSIPTEKRFASEQCLNSVYNLPTVIFRNRPLYSTTLRHGNQSRGEVSRAEENSEIRYELGDCTSRLESVHYGHEKVQDQDVRGQVLNLCDCITTVDCFRTEPPGMVFYQFVEPSSYKLTVVGN
jgi:hypothetical protein